MRARSNLLCLLMFSLATLFGASAAAKPDGGAPVGDKGGIDLVLAWNTTALPLPAPEDLAGFFGAMRSEDRLAVILDGRLARPLGGFGEGGASSAAFELTGAAKPSEASSGWSEELGAAVGIIKSHPRSAGIPAVVIVGTGAEGSAEASASDELLSDLLMAEISTYAVLGRSSAGISGAVSSTGGKLLVVDGGSAMPALSLIYDALQLRAGELSEDKTAEKISSVDYSYLDEKVETADEAVAASKRPDNPTPPPAGTSPVVFVLLAMVLLVNLGVIALLLTRSRPSKTEAKQAGASSEIHESPSFSRLTMGLNGFRSTFEGAGKRLDALALDLEDYGIESWDMEKKLLDEYSVLTKGIFLLLDHDELAGGKSPAETRRKIARLLEDAGIEGYAPSVGERFDGKRHVHAGERPDESAPGTILEVARKGYVKEEGLLHGEPLILRKAEVVVSAGDEAEKKGNQ